MVLDRLKTYYNLQTDSKLAELLGVQPNTLSMQRSRGTLPIEKIVERCSNVNMNWLLNKNADDQLPVHTLDESISYESLRVVAGSGPAEAGTHPGESAEIPKVFK